MSNIKKIVNIIVQDKNKCELYGQIRNIDSVVVNFGEDKDKECEEIFRDTVKNFLEREPDDMEVEEGFAENDAYTIEWYQSSTVIS